MSAEILEQVRLTRERPGATGNIHFSMKVFLENRDSIATRLASGIYAEPALVPRTAWLDSVPPRRPIVAAHIDSATGGVTLRLLPSGKEEIWRWIVRSRVAGAWTMRLLPGWQRSHALTFNASTPVPEVVLVSAVDRSGNETRVVRPRLPHRVRASTTAP
jgi:hypothetical protein